MKEIDMEFPIDFFPKILDKELIKSLYNVKEKKIISKEKSQ